LSIFKFIESYGEGFVDSAVVVVEVESHFGPMSDFGAVHDLRANKSAVILEPVSVDGAKLVFALAAPVMSWVFNIHPAIGGKSDSTGVIDAKGRIGYETGLVGLRGMVFIPFGFEIPVVVVGEIPSHDGFVVDEGYVD
jgi:hypothetical protein